MKTSAAMMTGALVLLFALALPGSSQVLFRLGGPWADEGRSIAVGPDGAIYVAGSFQGTVDFDPGPGVVERTAAGDPEDELTGAEAKDAYLAKFDSTGAFQWVKAFGAAGPDAASAIAVDPGGFVWLAGTFHETVSFEPAKGVFQLFAGSGQDAFLAKFAPDGGFLWATRLGDDETPPFEPDDPRFEEIFDLALDADGNVYVIGAFAGTMDIAGSPAPDAALASVEGSRDAFVASFGPTGLFRWAFSAGGPGPDEGRALAVGPSGPSFAAETRIVAAGVFSGTLLGELPGLGPVFFASKGGSDMVVIEGLAGGEIHKAWAVGGQGDDRVPPGGVALDVSGGLWLAGDFGLTIDLDPGPAVAPLASGGLTDAFLVRYAADGRLIWAAGMGGVLDDHAAAIVPDKSGGIYVTGQYRGPAVFDAGPPEIALPARGGGDAGDIYLAKFGPEGAFLWARGFGGTPTVSGESQGGAGLALDAVEHPCLIGSFLGTADFDPGPGQAALTGTGGTDAFVARFDPAGGLADARLLYPPLDFSGTRISNRSLSQREYIDILTWAPNPGDPGAIALYRIYEQDGEAMIPVDEVGASTFRYWRRRVDPDKVITYVLTAVDAAGGEGAPAVTVVR